jgi:hypothetical protein
MATAGRDDRRLEHFDKRPGGSCRLVLTYADASAARGTSVADSDVADARFVELVPGVRVAQQIEFVSEDPAFHGTMTMTRKVTPGGARSCGDISAEHVPDGINAADHAAECRPRCTISPLTLNAERRLSSQPQCSSLRRESVS